MKGPEAARQFGLPQEKGLSVNARQLFQQQNPLKFNKLGKTTPYFIFSIFFLSFGLAFAQVPPGQEAGAQAERFRQDTERKEKALETRKPKSAEIEMPEEKKEEAAAGEKISFTLKEVHVSGATVFQADDFKAIYEPYIGKAVTFADLEIITNGIKAKYQQKGYLTTTVFIPQQEIKEGSVEIRIAEGKLGALSTEGNRWFSSSLIEKYIHAKKNEILNFKDLQKDILRINQNPDLELKAVLAKGKEPQTSDIVLKIKEENFPWHAGFSEDNQGVRLTGDIRSAFTLRSTNTSGNFDALYMSTIFSTRSFGQSVSYRLPIDTYGTQLGFEYTFFKSKLGKEYKPNEIFGRTNIFTPYLTKELYLSELAQANLNLGLEVKSVIKKNDGTRSASDQLRTPYFSFDMSKLDTSGQTSFVPRFDFGTAHFLGASKRNHPTASRAGTGGFFFKYEQSLSRVQKMPWDSYAVLRTQFQAASHTLASTEQFQLGGLNSVRGYPEGDYLADIGTALNFDWTFPMYLIPADWTLPNSKAPLRKQIEPVFFYDFGWGKLKKTLAGERRHKYLAGIGGGFKFHFNNNFFALLEFASHLRDEPEGGQGPSTIHFSVQMEI